MQTTNVASWGNNPIRGKGERSISMPGLLASQNAKPPFASRSGEQMGDVTLSTRFSVTIRAVIISVYWGEISPPDPQEEL